MSRTSSGSRDSARPVKFSRSQNRTDTSRRSEGASPGGTSRTARSPAEPMVSRSGVASADCAWWLWVSARGLPQAVQKLNPAGTSVPQRPQVTASGLPQVPQNWAPGGFSNPQAVACGAISGICQLATSAGSTGQPELGYWPYEPVRDTGAILAVDDGHGVHQSGLQRPLVPENGRR